MHLNQKPKKQSERNSRFVLLGSKSKGSPPMISVRVALLADTHGFRS